MPNSSIHRLHYPWRRANRRINNLAGLSFLHCVQVGSRSDPLLFGRVQKRAEQAKEVGERAVAADVQWVRRVPLHGIRRHHIDRIQGAPIVELDAWPQMEGPHRQIGVGLAVSASDGSTAAPATL